MTMNDARARYVVYCAGRKYHCETFDEVKQLVAKLTPEGKLSQ